MDLFEYIKSQLPQMPNVAIMKDMGASDELVEYVKESPENTNLNVVESIINDNKDTPEIWLIGNESITQGNMIIFPLYNKDNVMDYLTELYDNAENYTIYLNNVELPYYTTQSEAKMFSDEEVPTMGVQLMPSPQYSGAMYMDISTAPESVEVSVKAK